MREEGGKLRARCCCNRPTARIHWISEWRQCLDLAPLEGQFRGARGCGRLSPDAHTDMRSARGTCAHALSTLRVTSYGVNPIRGKSGTAKPVAEFRRASRHRDTERCPAAGTVSAQAAGQGHRLGPSTIAQRVRNVRRIQTKPPFVMRQSLANHRMDRRRECRSR